MSDRSIEVDDFAAALEDILTEVQRVGSIGALEAVQAGIKAGAKEWRKNAAEAFPKGRTYRRHGKTYTSGSYARSIGSRMTDKSDVHPAGEVGSRKLPGLTHLLEFGHAKVGGGRVNGVEHVAPAAKVAFDAASEAAEKAITEHLE